MRERRIDLSAISLRQRESALVAGGSQAGKTKLSDYLSADFLCRYPKARLHISDTKPRYRAAFHPGGMSAARRYRHWDHGQPIPGSVLVGSPEDMDTAWRTGYRVTICSTSGWTIAQDNCIGHFHRNARRSRPQLVQVDELGDHFHGNGSPKGYGWVVVTSRAGMEVGEGGLYATQRTKGISSHLMEHMRRLYVFCLDVAGDAKRFSEFGCPIGPADLPTIPYQFLYWYKGDPSMPAERQARLRRTVWGPYRLDLEASPR